MAHKKRHRAGRVKNYDGRLGAYEGKGSGHVPKAGKGRRKLKITRHAKGWSKSRAKGRSQIKPTFKTLGKRGRKR